MADTDLPVRRLLRILEALGCTVEFTPTSFIKAWRFSEDGLRLAWMQHCHKGVKDTIRKHAVRIARRNLRLRECDGTSDESFYSAGQHGAGGCAPAITRIGSRSTRSLT